MTRQVLVSALLSLLAFGAAAAADIYKWVDAEGNVHYEDRPIGNPAERLTIDSRPTDRAAVREQVAAASEARAEARKAREEAAAAEPSAEDRQAEAARKAERCATYREQLQKMLTSRRLYNLDDNGERQYLNEEEMVAARARVQGEVEEYCGN